MKPSTLMAFALLGLMLVLGGPSACHTAERAVIFQTVRHILRQAGI